MSVRFRRPHKRLPVLRVCDPVLGSEEQTGARRREGVVIRVTTLYASTASTTARYYTKYLADAPGEIPGQWSGEQAKLLGLNGEAVSYTHLTLPTNREV